MVGAETDFWKEQYEKHKNDTWDDMSTFCTDEILTQFSTQDNKTQTLYIQRAIYCTLAVLSILGLIIVALSIFYNKKLREHPSPLIARICLVEAIMCWNSLMRFLEPKYIICYFNQYAILAATTTIPYYPSFLVLIWSNELIFNFFQLFSLGLNLFLCIDLVLTLWSPFEVARGRMKYYELLSCLVSGSLVSIIWFNQDSVNWMQYSLN